MQKHSQTNKHTMLSLADLPAARLDDLCAAANTAAKAHASPLCVFALPEGEYAFGPLSNKDLKKIECYLAAVVAAHDAHATRSKLALRLLTFSIKPRERDCTSAVAKHAWHVYEAARTAVNNVYPNTFPHAAAMQAIIADYFDLAPRTLAAWLAYIDFPAPRVFAVPTKDRALALHARETHVRALMYTILCTDARALAKCRGATSRADVMRARALLDVPRVQQYVMLNSVAAGSTLPHEYDDDSTIRDASLKRTRAAVRQVHQKAVTDVAFDDSSSDDDHDHRPRSTQHRKRACKA
jgi:hypothetical protein